MTRKDSFLKNLLLLTDSRDFSRNPRRMQPINPPTRFVRKPRNTEQRDLATPMLNCEAAARPAEVPAYSKSELKAVTFERSKYNRLIGEMIREEIEFYCDDLPVMDKTAYFEAMHLNILERKK